MFAVMLNPRKRNNLYPLYGINNQLIVTATIYTHMSLILHVSAIKMLELVLENMLEQEQYCFVNCMVLG